jgi:Leucine-rich repeat (LRR) protein
VGLCAHHVLEIPFPFTANQHVHRSYASHLACLLLHRILGLKSNRLTSLPLSFTSLCSLVELFLTDNQLTTLPQGGARLSFLAVTWQGS